MKSVKESEFVVEELLESDFELISAAKEACELLKQTSVSVDLVYEFLFE